MSRARDTRPVKSGERTLCARKARIFNS